MIMANISVIYFSKGRDLSVLAKIVSEVCGVEGIDMSKPHSLEQIDLLFIGIDARSGKTDQAVIDYLETLPANSIRGAALFSVSKDGKDYTEFVSAQLMHKGVTMYPKNLVIHSSSLFSKLKIEDLEKTRKYTETVLESFNG